MQITPATLAKSAVDSSASHSSVLPVQTLGQDDFLKLLVKQMTSQDPLNPQKDTEFIAQMAQFSALEQSKAMQADIAQMRDDQQIVQANGLLGRAVELQIDEQTIGGGVVGAVQVVAGTPRIVVNGLTYELSQVRSVSQAQSQPQN